MHTILRVSFSINLAVNPAQYLFFSLFASGPTSRSYKLSYYYYVNIIGCHEHEQ